MALGIKIPRNALEKGRESFSSNPNGGNNVELEPGTYLGVIKRFKGVDTGKGPQMVADIAVGGEECPSEVKGGTVSIWFSFEEERVVHMFRFLNKLGYDVGELDEDVLEEICDKIKDAGHVVRFKATEKDGYTNYRINKILEDMSADEVLEGATVSDSESSDEDKEEKKNKKDKKSKKDEEPENEDSAEEVNDKEDDKEDEIALKVGMKVKTKIKGEVVKVVVTAIDEAEGKVIVKSSKDDKKYRVSPESLLPA